VAPLRADLMSGHANAPFHENRSAAWQPSGVTAGLTAAARSKAHGFAPPPRSGFALIVIIANGGEQTRVVRVEMSMQR
jgi:hypothetical protein